MSRHKKSLKWICLFATFLFICLSAGMFYYLYQNTTVPLLFHQSHEVVPTFRCSEKRIEHYENGEWKEFKTAGVVISPCLPGEKEISKKLYLEWFLEIANMNATVIEVTDKMNPAFYEALYQYNTAKHQPLYLLQGVSLPGQEYDNMQDAVTGKLEKKLTKAGCEIINVLHGVGNSAYVKDVSPWVMGYLVGDKWDSELVLYTNEIQSEYAGFKGKYCHTWESATAFETVLARVGDNLFAYETGKFKAQKLLAFRNGAFTDPLSHDTSFSPGLYENLAHVNTQLIATSEHVKTGYFAAYDLPPYEPQCLSFDPVYTRGKNLRGKTDAFYPYLTKLNEYHQYTPVLISSFGLPASRGVSGVDEISGRNGGGLSESEQGILLKELFVDIMDSGITGGCLAAWQDDWSADTWNCTNLSVSSTLANWKDVQSANQNMGVMAVEPGNKESISYPDGEFMEWEGVTPLLQKEGITVQTLLDEAYVYFKIHIPNFSSVNQEVILPIDLVPDIGTLQDETNGVSYDKKADYALVIKDADTSRLMVQSRYDSYHALHHREETKENVYFKHTMPTTDSGEFVTVRQYVRKYRRNSHNDFQPPKALDMGILHHGNANPSASNYDSRSDFFINGEDIEVRIPWALLNFADPSQGKIVKDFYTSYGIEFCDLEEWYVGLVWKHDTNVTNVPSRPLSKPEWGAQPEYHFRKRQAYFTMQQAFENNQKK
ncbi:MAG: hypothetical protein RSF88_09400 [Lachnospiraceae bacterium]